MNKSLMIDIETLDTKPSAIVLSVGGCFFDLDNPNTTIQELYQNSIYLELNPKEQENKNRTISIDTLTWWLNNDLNLKAFFENISINTGRNLKLLSDFIISNQIKSVWSKSPSFDMNILDSLFSDFNMTFPIGFRDRFDVRTVLEIRKLTEISKIKLQGNGHHALNDAINQTLMICNVLNHIKSYIKLNEELQDLVTHLTDD